MACSVVTITLHTERLLQRFERHHERRSRTISVGNDTARPATPFALLDDGGGMIGVDLRDKQRHIRFHAVIFRVAEDRHASTREISFNLASHRSEEHTSELQS